MKKLESGRVRISPEILLIPKSIREANEEKRFPSFSLNTALPPRNYVI